VSLKVRDMVRAVVDETRFRANIDKMRGLTETRQASSIVKAVEVLAQKVDVTEHEKGNILEALAKGGDFTAWGFTNAVTAHASTGDLWPPHLPRSFSASSLPLSGMRLLKSRFCSVAGRLGRLQRIDRHGELAPFRPLGAFAWKAATRTRELGPRLFGPVVTPLRARRSGASVVSDRP
jgi:hypothetical protein